MSASFCWWCGAPLRSAPNHKFTYKVSGPTGTHDVHKGCQDEAQRYLTPVTAQPPSGGSST